MTKSEQNGYIKKGLFKDFSREDLELLAELLLHQSALCHKIMMRYG